MTTHMTSSETSGAAPPAGAFGNFSLVLGGPFYQIFRKTRLSGSALELLHRRIAVLVALTWVPLLALSAWEGLAWGNQIILPFIRDIDAHARFLVVIPILLIAEPIVHRRIPLVLEQFTSRQLIPPDALGQFSDAVASLNRLRNSVLAEIVLVILVYGVGVLFIGPRFAGLDVSNWRGSVQNGSMDPTLAGWWLGFVSLPIFQFLLFRWYYRLLIWARFLWQVSRIKLSLLATHPDRRGGLGFLGYVTHAFVPLVFAQGVLLSGTLANQVLNAGATLTDFKFDIVVFAAMALLLVLGPLLFFSADLAEARRTGRRDYGVLAQECAQEFDHKWLRGNAPEDEAMIGSADFSSLADMGASYAVIEEMRWLPFSAAAVIQLVIAILLPLAPLLLTVVPLDELVSKILKIIL